MLCNAVVIHIYKKDVDVSFSCPIYIRFPCGEIRELLQSRGKLDIISWRGEILEWLRRN
jgi:hypothetical protein